MAHKSPNDSSPLSITFLGGLEQVGMNALLLRYEDHSVMIDCGLGFPDARYHPGVEHAFADFSALEDCIDSLDAVLLTHGHEDHVGALSHLLPQWSTTVMGTPFALGIAKHRLRSGSDLQAIQPLKPYQIGPFQIEWIPVAHSIPESCALWIKTPAGSLFHSGDFKMDLNHNPWTAHSLQRLAQIGSEGLDLLLCESTNVHVPGFAPSEETLQQPLAEIFEKAHGRIFFVSFSTHIQRLTRAIQLAREFGRKVAFAGASMERNIQLARELGHLRLKAHEVVELADIHLHSPRRMLILATGSQAEPNATMARLSRDQHPHLQIHDDDHIIWSARHIPGNESSIIYTIDQLAQRGARVYHEPLDRVHVSGHGFRQDLSLLHQLLRPRWLVPIHGHQLFLQEHRLLATNAGIPLEHSLLCRNGDQLSLHKGHVTREEPISIAPVFRSRGTLDLSTQILKQRRILALQGAIFVSASLSADLRHLSKPLFSCSGFPLPEDQEAWESTLQEAFHETPLGERDPQNLQRTLKRALRNHIRHQCRLSPLITVLIHPSS